MNRNVTAGLILACSAFVGSMGAAGAQPAPRPTASPKKAPAHKPTPKPVHHAAAVTGASQSPQATSYTPPKLVQRGSTATAPGGNGAVTVQVLVKKDGSSTVIKVLKSSNEADNATALAIAKTSTYKPGIRNGQTIDAYYDYVLSFGTDTAAAPAISGTGAALAAIRAGKYDDAKSLLQTYLQAHPTDTDAYTLLGVANTFGGDLPGAAAAFDKAGTIPDQYKALAEQAYEKNAGALLDDKKYTDSIAAAGHAIDVNPQSLQGYYVRGVAEANMQNDTAAIIDLQKARTIAAATKSDDKTQVTLAYSLAIAQLDAGLYGEAATTAKEVSRTDTARSEQIDKHASVAVANAAIALANQGKTAESVSRFESGANAFPRAAPGLIAQAATVLATDKKPDWDKVQAEANKALALNPNSGRAEFILGIAAANQKDPKGALDYMNKAKASSDYSSDAPLAKQIDTALKQLNAPGNNPAKAGS
jgi:tetratricopeptide (TPR) repeat protein